MLAAAVVRAESVALGGDDVVALSSFEASEPHDVRRIAAETISVVNSRFMPEIVSRGARFDRKTRLEHRSPTPCRCQIRQNWDTGSRDCVFR